MPHRGTTTPRFEDRFSALLLVLTVTLGGCNAFPEGTSCHKCDTSLPLHVPLSIPFLGNEDAAVECGSACVPEHEHNSQFDDILTDDVTNAVTASSTYERFVNGVVVEPATTVVMSTFSIAGSAFGTVANYCVPEGALGPPETMPPGRFHPVPTRPVFAHRD